MSFLHIDMTQTVEIFHQLRQGPMYLFNIVNIMCPDVLATQGARAPATMMLTKLIRDNSVPARFAVVNLACDECVYD